MGNRLMLGEISGEELIEIGDIVMVKHKDGKKYGRLNKAFEDKILVMDEWIKVNNIISIKKR